MYPYPIAHFVDEDGKETKLHQTQHKVLKGGVKSWRAVRAWTRDGDAGRNDESDGHSAKRARETVPDEPAPARPSFPRIRELCGKARVDVMLSDFDGVFRGDARTARTMSCTMDRFLDLADYPGGNRVYLAQAPVPEQIPFHESSPTTSLGNLRQDLDRIPLRFHLREDAPDEYRDETVHSTNLWMSPAGSCSSPHFDDFDNLLCVVAGRKTVVVMDFGYIGAMGTPYPRARMDTITADTPAVDLHRSFLGAARAAPRAPSVRQQRPLGTFPRDSPQRSRRSNGVVFIFVG